MSHIKLSMVVRARTMSPTSVWTLPHSLSSAASSRVTTQTRDRDGSALIPCGADHSCGSNSSRADPPTVEGAGDVDTEAYPVATSAKDASGAPSSICPTGEVATRTDDSSDCDASAYDVVATPSCAMPITPLVLHLLTLDFGRFWKMTGRPTCGKKGIRQTKQAVG